MPESELVLFGRSPFINQVDVSRLCHRYTTIGLNHFADHFPVDYLFWYDQEAYDYTFIPSKIIVPAWFERPNALAEKIVPKAGRPIFNRIYENGLLCVGMQLFTVSLALNWAILQGFKTIYLVGIDHDDSVSAMAHYDDSAASCEILPEAHERLKDFVNQCQFAANIYQTNPGVSQAWPVPYKNIEDLYNGGDFDLNIQQNADYSFIIYVQNADNSPKDLTGYGIKLQIRPYAGASLLYDEFDLNSGITVSGNAIIAHISYVQTAYYNFTSGSYDCLIEDLNGIITRVCQGIVNIEPGITVPPVNTPTPSTTAVLDFSHAANSQYLPLI